MTVAEVLERHSASELAAWRQHFRRFPPIEILLAYIARALGVEVEIGSKPRRRKWDELKDEEKKAVTDRYARALRKTLKNRAEQ